MKMSFEQFVQAFKDLADDPRPAIEKLEEWRQLESEVRPDDRAMFKDIQQGISALRDIYTNGLFGNFVMLEKQYHQKPSLFDLDREF